MRTFLILSIAGTFLAGAGGARGDDAKNDAKSVVEKAIKAHGGEEHLAKYKGSQSRGKGTLEVMGLVLDIRQESTTMAPDKLKEVIEFEVGGMKIRQVVVFNGAKVSIKANGTEVPLTDEIKAALKDAQDNLRTAGLSGLLKNKEVELSLIGEEKVNGKPAVGVRIARKGQKDISLYFDKETSLTVKTARRAVDPMTGNDVEEERIVLEYTKGDKTPTPKKVLVNRDGKKFLELEIEETKLLEKVDDSEFAD